MTIPADLTRDDALRGLCDQVATHVALPGQPGYERCMPWNVAAPVTPAAVVLATTAEDVAGTVRFAAAHGFTVAVQATGHGAVGVDNDTVLVLTAAMKHVDVDAVNRTARVGAGARWQDVLEAAAPHGLAPLCGSAPGVGVVGYLTGGGIGPLVRTFGLSSDHVRAFDVVTGEGRLVRATPTENADLFWGLRGGKATLGIVTAVEMDLLAVAEFYGGAVCFDGVDAAAVLHAWARWNVALPETVNTSIAIQQLPPLPGVPEPLAGRMTVAVRYAAVGDFAEAERLLAPMRAVATPILDSVGVLPYTAIGAVHADPVDPMPIHEDQALLTELPAEAVDALLALAGPQSGSPQVIVELRALGGALARQPRHRSAFCHRDAAFSLAVIGVPMPDAGAVIEHARAVTDSVAAWATGGQMPNFAPSYDSARPARVYDADTLHWLAALADRYDPARVLATGQVIRT
ncbi:FAD-binding oxidoreductase [Mycobacterium sp. SMC-4]|uniref:FAD-binding oxidoreductase n=1 Tax=Mycobacterium sp. SMC-4 TaxID=2857059 RepID=UPI003D094269